MDLKYILWELKKYTCGGPMLSSAPGFCRGGCYFPSEKSRIQLHIGLAPSVETVVVTQVRRNLAFELLADRDEGGH